MEQQLLERSPELDVEDGIDDGIQEAVDVAEPDEEAEQHAVDVAFRSVEQLKPDADGVHYVHGEEWHPTEQEHTWKSE